jgi:DNA-binding NtrC family response regulator
VRSERPQAVLLDIRMPHIGGMDLLQSFREEFPAINVIIITGYGTVENAVRAMRCGATNFFTKPVSVPEIVTELERLTAARDRKEAQPQAPAEEDSLVQYVTQDEGTLQVLTMAERAAETDATVLITGESGTGKELVANLIQSKSRRADGPFVKINCAAIPEELLESELFGHEPGAFTDARERKIGLFEKSRGGTLFLDEIGDMSHRVQAKLLRVLQDQQFTRVGGTETLHADVRIIAATNRTIESLLDEAQFRSDLYYRIAVIHLELKPLRERARDVLLLAEHFLLRFSVDYGKVPLSWSQQARELLQDHTWPGNIRELKNLVQRLVIFADGNVIDCSDFPEQYRIYDERFSAARRSEQREELEMDLEELSRQNTRKLVVAALNKAGGVKQEAARLLNVNRKTLYNWMRELNLL